jgi:hypothetical protein
MGTIQDQGNDGDAFSVKGLDGQQRMIDSTQPRSSDHHHGKA